MVLNSEYIRNLNWGSLYFLYDHIQFLINPLLLPA